VIPSKQKRGSQVVYSLTHSPIHSPPFFFFTHTHTHAISLFTLLLLSSETSEHPQANKSFKARDHPPSSRSLHLFFSSVLHSHFSFTLLPHYRVTIHPPQVSSSITQYTFPFCVSRPLPSIFHNDQSHRYSTQAEQCFPRHQHHRFRFSSIVSPRVLCPSGLIPTP
jgi:hypothetical protein